MLANQPSMVYDPEVEPPPHTGWYDLEGFDSCAKQGMV
jgi:hypothetical protein